MKTLLSIFLTILSVQLTLGATRIDVVVCYDTSHRDYWGGHQGMKAQAEYLLNYTKGVFDNGNLDVEFNIVHIYCDTAFDYTKDDLWGWFLVSYKGGYHGDIRDAFGADLLMFFVRQRLTFGYKGRAEMSGYCVADARHFAAIGQEPGYITAHEIGHTFGGGHDLGYGDGLHPYSHAYKWSWYGVDYWTIIADGTHENSGRIPYFSDPSQTYLGHPIGAPAFIPPNMDPNPNGADNTLTINNYKATAAARESQSSYLWRDSTVVADGYHSTSWFGNFDLEEWDHRAFITGHGYGRYLYHDFLEWCWIDENTLSTNSIWMYNHKYSAWVYTDDSYTRTAWVEDGSTGWVSW